MKAQDPPSSPSPAAASPLAQSSPASLRGLVSYSLTSGLCALIPLPFVDDWARDLVRKRMARGLLEDHGVQLDGEAFELLALGDEPFSAQSAAAGCLRTVVLWPVRFLYKLLIKKLLRKLVFVLAVKDAVDTFSRTFHEGFLLRHALRLGALDDAAGRATPVDLPAVRPVRAAIEGVMETVDPRPVERAARITFRSSRSAFRGIVSRLGRGLRGLGGEGRRDEDRAMREIERDTEGMQPMVDRLTAKLGEDAGYLERLRERLAQRLATRPDVSSEPSSD